MGCEPGEEEVEGDLREGWVPVGPEAGLENQGAEEKGHVSLYRTVGDRHLRVGRGSR